MSDLKKRQGITILLLLALLAALGAGCFLADGYRAGKQEKEGQETALFSTAADDIAGLRYTTDEGELSLKKEEGVWKLEEDSAFPVEQEVVEEMIETAVSVKAMRLVSSSCRDLSEYGLDAPALEIEMEDAEGNRRRLSCGMEAAAADGLYACTEDQSLVYLIPSDLAFAFSYTKNELMELPELPALDEDRIWSYSFRSADGYAFRAERNGERDEENRDAGEKEQNAAEKDRETEEKWNIRKSEGKVTDYDRNRMEEITACLSELELIDGVSCRAGKKEKKKVPFGRTGIYRRREIRRSAGRGQKNLHVPDGDRRLRRSGRKLLRIDRRGAGDLPDARRTGRNTVFYLTGGGE